MKTITDLITALISEANRSERGQGLILGVIALFALMGFTALTIDVGIGFGARSQAQRAVDSAAYAATLEHLLSGASDADSAQAAYKWAAANGYDNSDPDTTVVVNIPPLSGPHAGDDFFVEVIIYDQEGTYFADVLGTDVVAPPSVTSRYTGGAVPCSDGSAVQDGYRLPPCGR